MAGGGRLIVSSLSQDRHLSPLGCYIAAHRMGRVDIAEHFASAAMEQHRACPLYEVASLAFLPPDRYPADAPAGVQGSQGSPRPFRKSIVMN